MQKYKALLGSNPRRPNQAEQKPHQESSEQLKPAFSKRLPSRPRPKRSQVKTLTHFFGVPEQENPIEDRDPESVRGNTMPFPYGAAAEATKTERVSPLPPIFSEPDNINHKFGFVDEAETLDHNSEPPVSRPPQLPPDPASYTRRKPMKALVEIDPKLVPPTFQTPTNHNQPETPKLPTMNPDSVRAENRKKIALAIAAGITLGMIGNAAYWYHHKNSQNKNEPTINIPFHE